MKAVDKLRNDMFEFSARMDVIFIKAQELNIELVKLNEDCKTSLRVWTMVDKMLAEEHLREIAINGSKARDLLVNRER